MKYSRYGTKSRRIRNRAEHKARRSRQLAGTLLRCAGFLFLVIISVVGIRLLPSRVPTYTHADFSQGKIRFTSLSSLAGPRAPETQIRNRRLVYPYSIVPGGVLSAQELREAAAHDSTVARHYTGFNYDRARVTEVKQARLVYLSYRRGDKVYWTRKQVSLHPGETLLTDGKTTARTRCGNQVSVLPQADTSPEEPQQAELDRPNGIASGIEALPGNFDSELLDPAPILPLGPGGGTFSGTSGGVPSGFIPLPGPGLGGGGTGKPPGGGVGGGGGGGCVGTNCNHPPPPTPVPEPGAAILVVSGAVAMLTRFRYGKRAARE